MGDGRDGIDKVASSWTLRGWSPPRTRATVTLRGLKSPSTWMYGTTTKTSMSPIAFEFSKPFPLHSCKLHALLSAAHILFACLLELCEDCLTCAKIAKICQELKLGKDRFLFGQVV